MKGFFISVGMVLFVVTACAQTEGTLYFMNSLPQVFDVNPSFMPRYKTSIGLPGISSFGGVYANNSFTYNDIVTKVDGVAKINLSEWTKGLAENNYLNLAAFADVFRVGLRINPNLYLMAGATARQYNTTMIPKGLATILVDGTASSVGSYSNTSPQIEMISYLETSLGAAYAVNDKLTIGGRLKYLLGQSNITTENSSLIVEVDNNYKITMTGDVLVNTSGISKTAGGDYSLSGGLGKNTGWGLDIGATYKFMEKLTVSLSINDLGFIHWDDNNMQYKLDPQTAKYTFSGIDVNYLIDDNTDYLSQQLDSLKAAFEVTDAPTGAYTTHLPTKIYLGGKYELIPNLSIGTLFFGESFSDRFSAGMTASVNKDFGKWVSTSLTYTMSNRSYNNIGLGVSFNLSPVQIYFLGDNLLMAPVSLISGQNLNDYLNGSQLITLRAGINIVFGWDKISKTAQASDESHNPRKKGVKTKTKTTFGRSPAKKN